MPGRLMSDIDTTQVSLTDTEPPEPAGLDIWLVSTETSEETHLNCSAESEAAAAVRARAAASAAVLEMDA
ncbi:MAG: hypothetical protein Q4B08_04670, partial [Propionibacteriaceae bacterium]|nr:hypothetical protein [Propionibacteriaceae bacterium]